MRILTAPLTAHDASICILEDGKIIEYWMEERYSRLKNDQYALPDKEVHPYFNQLIERSNQWNETIEKILASKGFYT